MVLKMLTQELSKQMEAHLMRIEKEKAQEALLPEVQTMDYVPWEDCLPDGMLAVLFQRGVTG
jgi:hypothetical protein